MASSNQPFDARAEAVEFVRGCIAVELEIQHLRDPDGWHEEHTDEETEQYIDALERLERGLSDDAE